MSRYPSRKPHAGFVPIPAVIDSNMRYSLPEAAAILRQSLSKTFKDIAEKKLATRPDGGRTYVLGSELIRRSKMYDDPGGASTTFTLEQTTA
jgi:hypothetical protein